MLSGKTHQTNQSDAKSEFQSNKIIRISQLAHSILLTLQFKINEYHHENKFHKLSQKTTSKNLAPKSLSIYKDDNVQVVQSMYFESNHRRRILKSLFIPIKTLIHFQIVLDNVSSFDKNLWYIIKGISKFVFGILEIKTIFLELNIDLSMDHLQEITRSIRFARGLKNLSIICNKTFATDENSINYKKLYYVVDRIKKLKKLNNITIEGGNFVLKKITNSIEFAKKGYQTQSLKTIKTLLEFFRSMENLKINLEGTIIQSYFNSIDKFWLSIAQFRDLKQLFVDLSKTKIKNPLKGFSELQKIKNLTDLSLDLSFLTEAGDETTDIIAEMASKLSFTKLRIYHLGNFIYPKFQNLSNFLSTSKTITVLDLTFPDNSNVSDSGIAYLANGLQGNKSLKDIALDFKGCKFVTVDGIQAIITTLSNLKYLTVLNLKIGSISISIDKDSQISKFSLITINYEDSDPEKLDFIVTKLPFLDDVTINYSKSNTINVKSIERFCKALSQLKELKYLQLKFDQNSEMKDECVFFISEVLPTFTSLKQFSINFDWNPSITCKSLISLSKAIPKLKNLEALHFNFVECVSIKSDGIIEISRSIRKLEFLTFLAFEFHWDHLISDFAIFGIANIIEGFTKLQSLTFNFGVNQNQTSMVTGKSIILLALSLRNNKNLQKLKFSFPWAKDVNDKTINDLALSISNFPQLKVLDISFYGCSEITNAGLLVLSQVLQILLSLKSIELTFGVNTKIESNPIENIVNAFYGLEKLDFIKLSFNKCPNIDFTNMLVLRKLSQRFLRKSILKDNFFLSNDKN